MIIYCYRVIKIYEFDKWEERHNGHHIIHVTRWWRHHIHRQCVVAVRSGWQVTDCVWINPKSRYIQRACNFWMPIWQGGIALALQSNCGFLTRFNNPISSKIAQGSGELAGSHFEWAVNSPHWIPIVYHLFWIWFCRTRAIACKSSLAYLFGRCTILWVTALCENWVWLDGSHIKYMVATNFRKCTLFNSKSAQEYTNYACSMFFVTSFLHRVISLHFSLF